MILVSDDPSLQSALDDPIKLKVAEYCIVLMMQRPRLS